MAAKPDQVSQLNELASQGGLRNDAGGLVVAGISGVALLFSAYSLWESSLKTPDLSMFVPPVIYYAYPYNNNFEMIAIPVTVINEGAQTGTALYFDLEVTDPRTNRTKRFYSAEFGVWSMERTRARAYTGFAPMSLQGHSSRAESILFYTKGEAEKPDQIIREVGPYQFKLTLVEAEGSRGWFGGFWKKEPQSITFERNLPFYDARSFEVGTIFMHSSDWTAASQAPRVPRPDGTPQAPQEPATPSP